MKPESLVQLIGGGNIGTVEEEWMRLLEATDARPAKLAGYDVVLRALCDTGNKEKADALAWAAIETLSGRFEASDTLAVAGPLLLAIGESDELRTQVVELYRQAYADREGLDSLLTEAGLGGGRPVRRALRTLDVCLNVSEGGYLAARHHGGAARIESIDRSDWTFGLKSPDGDERLGAVHLADNYRPARDDEFAVLAHFASDGLRQRLWDDPIPIVIDLCRHHGNKLESDALEATLVPGLLTDAEWKKWSTKLRTEVRRCPQLSLDGRLPFTLTYTAKPASPEEALIAEFDRLRDPTERFQLVESYLAECSALGGTPDAEVLRRCRSVFVEHAERLIAGGSPQAGLWAVIALRIARDIGLDDGAERAVNVFRNAADVGAVFAQIDDDALHELARECLIQGRPDDWPDRLMELLPTFPVSACDRTVERLVSAGKTRADFEPIIQQILASPVPCFEALLWLWNGPAKESELPAPGPVNVMSRILGGLDDARRSETIEKELVKKINGRARAVLAARRYERYDRCLGQLEPGVAATFRTQLRRMDSLGRVVRDELLSRLNHRFPPVPTTPDVLPWAREDVLYVTQAGLAKKQNEIEHHVNVKMKQNAIAIGQAAEHGDLSENSEYKFALEERDLLRARLGQMNAEVAAARVISAEDVPTNHVGIGSRVTFRRVTDGEPYEVAFMGPWEADASKGWINYKAPLSQSVLGKRVGDKFEFEHSNAVGTYEIVKLGNALAEEVLTS